MIQSEAHAAEFLGQTAFAWETAEPGPTAEATLLERGLPFRELSFLAVKDQRSPDPALATHRWWARRPPAVFRGLLLAATLGGEASWSEFWERYRAPDPHLEGWAVYDPFVGGGTTLIEAQRLGARVLGTDIDPLAVEIVHHALCPPDVDELRAASEGLLAHLQERIKLLYQSLESGDVPLHFFYVRLVQCRNCGDHAPLYRDLILARDEGKAGSVARRYALEVFCPDCFRVHHLDRVDRVRFECCARYHNLNSGTYERFRFTCPSCGTRAGHKQLQTGTAPLKLVAIEEVPSKREPRAFRQPTGEDEGRRTQAMQYLMEYGASLRLPTREFCTSRHDERPLSFGVTQPAQLFSHRQLALFGTAFAWIDSQNLNADVRRALQLAISNSLTTNNLLCGYARDYGRLAPLFSVRSYALPALTVELNPFSGSAGRGTIRGNLDRVAQSIRGPLSRYVWKPSSPKLERSAFSFSHPRPPVDIKCASASEGIGGGQLADLAMFDPPYFDYIAYSELSEFYRAWWLESELPGASLLPDRKEPIHSFADGFATALTTTLKHTKPNGLLVFTFHSSSPAVWKAVGKAIDTAQLSVTGLAPVLTDARMGHHSYDGNCEWDIVIAARRSQECQSSVLNLSMEEWVEQAKPLTVSEADRASMQLALAMAAERYAVTRGESRRRS